jgi:hypothetical protein
MLIVVVFLTAAHAEDCYKSSIIAPVPFMGNNGEVFKLADGSSWKVKYEYSYLYAYYPEVVICPSRGKLLMDEKSLNVQLVSAPRDSAKPKSIKSGNGPK